MRRSAFAPLLIVVALALCSATSLTAQRQIGGGVGYLFDTREDYIVLQGQARLPIKSSHWSVVPGIQLFLGQSTVQANVNLIYNIETAGRGRLHPYAGIGAGIVHTSFDEASETKPLLNLIAGTTFDMKNSAVQLFFESIYSSGIEYTNTETLHGGFLVHFGRR